MLKQPTSVNSAELEIILQALPAGPGFLSYKSEDINRHIIVVHVLKNTVKL